MSVHRGVILLMTNMTNIGLDHDEIAWAIERATEVPNIEDKKGKLVGNVMQSEGDVVQTIDSHCLPLEDHEAIPDHKYNESGNEEEFGEYWTVLRRVGIHKH